MMWPRHEDWWAHLARYDNGRSSLAPRLGPRGGFVDALGYEHITCHTCGAVAVWPPFRLRAQPRPPGHRIEKRGGSSWVEVCPGFEDPP